MALKRKDNLQSRLEGSFDWWYSFIIDNANEPIITEDGSIVIIGSDNLYKVLAGISALLKIGISPTELATVLAGSSDFEEALGRLTEFEQEVVGTSDLSSIITGESTWVPRN
jgi:UDP-N-acetylmuramyl tripeptide synthase